MTFNKIICIYCNFLRVNATVSRQTCKYKNSRKFRINIGAQIFLKAMERRKRERERESERERERDRDRDRDRGRQTERKTERKKERKKERER